MQFAACLHCGSYSVVNGSCVLGASALATITLFACVLRLLRGSWEKDNDHTISQTTGNLLS